MRIDLLLFITFLCALPSLIEAQTFVQRAAAFHVKTILPEQAYNSTHYPIGITFHPVRKTYYTVWRGYNTIFVRPRVVDNPGPYFAKGPQTSELNSTYSYINGINFQRNITGYTSHRGIFFVKKTDAPDDPDKLVLLTDGTSGNTDWAEIDPFTLDKGYSISMSLPTDSAGGIAHKASNPEYSSATASSYKWLRYNNSTRSFEVTVGSGSATFKSVGLIGTENTFINARTRMFQGKDTSGFAQSDTVTVFDYVTGVWRTYGGTYIFESYIKSTCVGSNYSADAFLGIAEDGLYWLWDQGAGVYRGFDINFNWFEATSDSISSITRPSGYTFTDNSSTTCYGPNVHPNITGYPTVTLLSGVRLGLDAMSHTMSQYHRWEYTSASNLGLGTDYTCPTPTSNYASSSMKNMDLRRAFRFFHPYNDGIVQGGGEQIISHQLFSNPSQSVPTYLRLATYPNPQECGVPTLPWIYDCSLRVNPAGSTMTFSDNATLSTGCSIPVKRTFSWGGCKGGQQIDPTANFQEITVRDTLAPSITAPAYTSGCDISALNVTITDSCIALASLNVTYSDSVLQAVCANGITKIVNRTVTATDPCANQAQASQIITIVNVQGVCQPC